MKKFILSFTLLLLMCLPLSTSAASLAAEQVYDNTVYENEIIIPAETSGTWKPSTAIKNYDGSNSHKYSTTQGDSMTYKVPNIKSGYYEVYYWVCPHVKNLNKVNFTIVHNGKTDTSFVYQQLDEDETQEPGWVSMGKYTFSGDGSESIYHVLTSVSNVRATGVKLVPREREGTVVVSGKAVLQAANLACTANHQGVVYKTYGFHYGTSGSGAYGLGNSVQVHVNIPKDGDYYVYSDLRTYDKKDVAGSDTNRSFAMDIVQNGITIPIQKEGSTEHYYFGSFQGHTGSYQETIGDGVCFRSPQTVHLKKGHATLVLNTQTPWLGISFIALSEEGTPFSNAIESSTKEDNPYKDYGIYVYKLLTSGDMYKSVLPQYLSVTTVEPPTFTNSIKNAEGTVVYTDITHADVEVVGFYYALNGTVSNFIPKGNAEKINLSGINPSQDNITAYAVDKYGNISSEFGTLSGFTETEFITQTFTSEVPQKVLFGAKSDSSSEFSVKITDLNAGDNLLHTFPVDGAYYTMFWQMPSMRPINAQDDKTPTQFKIFGATNIVQFNPNLAENAEGFEDSSIDGYDGGESYYARNETATFIITVPVTDTFTLKYYVPNSDDKKPGEETVEFLGQSINVDTANNRGQLVTLGEFTLEKGKEYPLTSKKTERTQYIRPAAVVVEQKTLVDSSKSVFGLGECAEKIDVDVSVIAAQNCEVESQAASDSQVIFTLNLQHLLAKKTDLPNGKVFLKTSFGEVFVPYGDLDLQALIDSVSDGVNDTILKVLIQSAPNNVLTVHGYVQSGSNCKEAPQAIKLCYQSNFGKTAVFTLNNLGVPTDKEKLNIDGTTLYTATAIQNGTYNFTDKLEYVEALKDGNNSLTVSDFAKIAYNAFGVESTNTDTTIITREKAAEILADILIKTNKRVITLTTADSMLAQFGDSDQIAEQYKNSVYVMAESGIIRGDGATSFNPKGELTENTAYEWLNKVLSLNEYVGPMSKGNLELVFHDEFITKTGDNTYNGIDTSVWTLAAGTAPTHIASYRGQDDQIAEDGYLKLLIRKEPWTYETETAGWESGNWRSGDLKTKNKYKYGYYEAVYRYPQGTSDKCNNSFWLRTQSGNYVELDVNEGRIPSKIATNIHYTGYVDETGAFVPNENEGARKQASAAQYMNYDLSQDFHKYGLEWTEEKLVWYFDDQPIRTYMLEGKGQFDCAVYFSVAIMQLKDGYSNIIPPSETNAYDVEFADLDGKSMDVEYVRVYQYK